MPTALPFLILPPIFWGSNFAVGRAIEGDIDPFLLNYLRWLVALILLAPLGMRSLIISLPLLRARWMWLVALSGLSVVCFNTLVYTALLTLPAAEGALLHAATPCVAMALSAAVLKERFHLRCVLGAALSCTGAVLVIGTSIMAWSFSSGSALMLLTVLIWALYSVLLKLRPSALPPATLLLAVVALGVAMQTPFWLVLEHPVAHLSQLSPKTAATILYLGAVASGVAYWLWDKGVEAVGPAVACQYFHVTPLSAMVLAWIFLGEPMMMQQLAGGCLIITGLLCASWRHPTRLKTAGSLNWRVSPKAI